MTQQLPEASAAPDRSAESHTVQALSRFLRAVRYRKGVMIVALLASVLLGGLYYVTTPPVFESSASVLILQTKEDPWSPDMAGGAMARDLMDTYRNMVSSEAVLEDALKYLRPEDRVDLANAPRERWTKILKSNLKVTLVRKTNIMDIAYWSKDPHAAAAVVNAVLSAYLDFMNKLHKSTAREILDILTKKERDLEQELRAKEAELAEMRSRAGKVLIRDGDQGVNVVARRAVRLNELFIEAHQKRLEAQSQLAAIESAIRSREDLQQHALAMIESVGREVLLQRLGLSAADAQTISRVNQQLFEDQAKLRTQLQLYGPANRKVLEIQERIRVAEDYLRGRLRDERTGSSRITYEELAELLKGMARQEFEQTVEHENAILASYEEEEAMAIALNHSMTQLDNLQHDLDRLRGYYDVVLKRVSDIDLGEETGMLRTSVLSQPEVQLAPVAPRLRLVALLSLLMGLGGGLAVVYLLDLLDDHFRSLEELQMQLGLPVLAMVRKLKTVADQGMEAVYVHVRPNAAEAEAFRTLRTALALAEDSMQRLVVSSGEPGDGKTTIIANLAVVYAQSGKRTLLIDADMRRPGLTPMLALKGQRGLSTVLRDEGPVGKAVEANLYCSVRENLDVLASGPRPGNPTELLASDRFAELLSWAEAGYDQILIDSPPALVSDTAIIGRLVDGVLLAVRPEKNRRRAVIRAAESFPLLGIRVLGIVVNCLTTETGEGYYDYDYGYGYGYGYGHDEDSSENNDTETEETIRPSVKISQKAA